MIFFPELVPGDHMGWVWSKRPLNPKVRISLWGATSRLVGAHRSNTRPNHTSSRHCPAERNTKSWHLTVVAHDIHSFGRMTRPPNRVRDFELSGHTSWLVKSVSGVSVLTAMRPHEGPRPQFQSKLLSVYAQHPSPPAHPIAG
jgi:hypothetical protein